MQQIINAGIFIWIFCFGQITVFPFNIKIVIILMGIYHWVKRTLIYVGMTIFYLLKRLKSKWTLSINEMFTEMKLSSNPKFERFADQCWDVETLGRVRKVEIIKIKMKCFFFGNRTHYEVNLGRQKFWFKIIF